MDWHVMLVVGELFNFAAYAFAPAVLVTPLGAISVLTGTVLGAYFLKERLSALGKMGIAHCLVGSVLVVANAPPDKTVETVDEILAFAVQPGVYGLSEQMWGWGSWLTVYQGSCSSVSPPLCSRSS